MGLVGILAIAATIAVAAVIWVIVWFGQFAGALPPPDQLTAQASFQTTPVLASDGTTRLYEITDPRGGRRTVVGLDQVPRYLVEATIVTEDASFFSNPGFELRAILRAGLDDLTHKEIVSGASTITQQVVRNILLTPADQQDLSARRKVKEIVLAYQLTQTYTKEQILEVYLNEINYGNRSYGIEAAAEGYFGKPAANLDLAECALLAGLPQAPSYFDPYVRLDEVKSRQEYILQRMVTQGYISADQAQVAADEPLDFVDRRHAFVAPHFVTYVSDLLVNQLGADQLYRGGNSAVTTLDVPLQDAAEKAVAAHLADVTRAGGNNTALVALDPRDGHILAMVGSANYDDANIAGEVNMALAPLPSGGVLTPLTYALALQNGQTLASRIDDSPIPIAEAGGSAVPINPNDPHHYLGPVTLRQALGLGLDVPATRILRLVGSQPLIDLGTSLGIADFGDRLDYTANHTIANARVSPLEVAQVYAMLANGGTAEQPIAVQQIRDRAGHLVEQTSASPRGALDPGVAYLVTSVLTDPTVRPPEVAPLVDVGSTVASKVTLSDDQRNAWAAGYVPNLAVVVWVGNSNGKRLTNAAASAEIWADFSRQALKLYPPPAFAAPADVTEVTLCKNPGCSQKQTELALRGTEKAVTAANASAIAAPVAPTIDSKTPLVNRDQSPPADATNAAPSSDNVAPAPITGAVIVVPSVAGTTPDQARARLAAAGLGNAPLIQYQSGAGQAGSRRTTAVGKVVGTSPAAGERVAPGTSIVLIVQRN
jgi:membrane peptidoglycan carboxypeptidase